MSGVDLKPIDIAHGLSNLRDGMHLQGSDVFFESGLVTECIRSFLFDSGTWRSSRSVSSIVEHIVDAAFDLAAVERQSERKLEIIPYLTHMNRVGDLSRREGGYWQLQPVSFLRIPGPHNRGLAFGGGPSWWLTREYGTAFDSAGLARTLQIDDLPKGTQTDLSLWDSATNWTIDSKMAISWRNSILQVARQQSKKVDRTGLMDMEVYVPRAVAAKHNGRQWVKLPELDEFSEDQYVARVKLTGRLHQYAFALLTVRATRRGRAIIRSYGLTRDDYRRLRLLIDADRGEPAELKINSSETGSHIQLYVRFPEPEARLFDFAVADSEDGARITYWLPSELELFAEKIATNLGLKVTRSKSTE